MPKLVKKSRTKPAGPRLHARTQRLIFGSGLAVAFTLGVLWFLSPGLPVWWGPSASAHEIAAGKELFEHEWTANDPLAGGDGLGPVFNAKSCVACHFQGGVGGGGNVMHNAMGFEVLPRPSDPTFRTGTVHNFSIDPKNKETTKVLHKQFPNIPGRTLPPPPGHCGGPETIPDFEPVRTQSVQATALFGAGWIDRISSKAITHNLASRAASGTLRELSLKFDGVPMGAVRTLPDGRIGKFGWKAQFATLEEFVAAACANELGLGTPYSEQAKPITGPPVAAVNADLDKKQFRHLLAFVDTLPKPVEVIPTDPTAKLAAAKGKELFSSVGCAQCHVPDLGGVKGVYSDFLLYPIEDPQPPSQREPGYGSDPLPDLPLPPDLPKQHEWKTQPLWGVADSAPYFHDGASPTLHAAIVRHRGAASQVTDAYTKLSKADQEAVVAFLRTLKAPPDAAPVRDMSVTNLAKK